jgi:predicted nucleic-acid-binding protein
VIGVDTNVLVRYLTQDDARQARAVNAFFSNAAERGETLHIADVVMCELVWVLRAAYGYDKGTIADAIEKMLNTALFAFDDRDLLRAALTDYRNGSGDFADYLIGHRNASVGCEHTVTFDKPLRTSALFTLL